MGKAREIMGGQSKVIRADNLWKKFGRHEALRGLSFSIPEGSAYALIGANGAGKTTTIRILMNILEAERGKATVFGVDSRRLSPRELAQIGYVSENQDMPARLTVAEYLDYLRPFYPTWDEALEASIRAQLRLPPTRRIGDLSHGMRMKMALAGALPFRPKLLILDEPFSGLDPLVRDEFMEELLQQAGEMTVLISSHELNEIDGVATHVGFLDEGKLLFEESMSDLNARFREVHVTLDREASWPGHAPPSDATKAWLNVRTVGNVLMFVDSRFSEDRLSAGLGSLNGSVRNVDTQPMALRSIFTALARAARQQEDVGKG
jgi:ABC-2 type transport system ATP-binding protein